MQLFIVIILTIFTITINAYRWTVIEEDTKDECNGKTCGARPHSVCLALTKGALPTATCLKKHTFKWLHIGPAEKRSIVDGHNGLRNRVARSHFLPVSDMNVLHWDEDLQLMAKGWIGQCLVNQLDECQFICKGTLYFLNINALRINRKMMIRIVSVRTLCIWMSFLGTNGRSRSFDLGTCRGTHLMRVF